MANENVNQTKNSWAESYLQRLLLLTPPGGKLPGMRTLIVESGVGRVRLEHVLAKLCSEGKVESRSRSGYYRCAESECSKRMLLLDIEKNDFSLPPASRNVSMFASFWQQIEHGLADICRNNGYELTLYSLQGSLSGAVDFFRNNHFAGCFFRGVTGSEVTELISQYCCVVDVLPHNSDGSFPGVIDSPQMTIMQMEYLLQRGYRNIGYLHQIENTRQVVQLQRLCDYYRIMAENNIAVEPGWGMYCGYEWKKFNRHLYEVMSGKHPPEALIVAGNTVPAVYRFCFNNGIEIGRELAIMGCDDLAPELRPRCTSVTNTPSEIAEKAWRVMQAALHGEKLIEYTDLKIITGESVPYKNQ